MDTFIIMDKPTDKRRPDLSRVLDRLDLVREELRSIQNSLERINSGDESDMAREEFLNPPEKTPVP